MPFTPLHMGPGMWVKALAGRHFSVLTFGIAQVAMDIEPLAGMLRGAAVLHGATHTYLAALLIGALVALVAPPLASLLLRRWNRGLPPQLAWLAAPEAMTPVAVLTGAFGGTLSHVLLDSLMHSDMAPLAPWSNANALLGALSIDALNLCCLVAGLLGLSVWLAATWRNRRSGPAGNQDSASG